MARFLKKSYLYADIHTIRKQVERNTIMGMSASQARFLSLTARKTNVEYEGQQINQQRTTLSNETASYYSRLTNMSVPTPPSSADYTKTTYTFTDGSEKNTINSLIATRDGYYILNYTRSTQVDSVVSNGNVIVTRKNTAAEGQEPSYEYSIGAAKLRPLKDEDSVANDPYLSTLSPEQLNDALEVEKRYFDMLEKKYKDNEWLVRYQKNSATGAYEPVFYNTKQVREADYSQDSMSSLTAIKSYAYGQTIDTQEIRNAKATVEKDSSGRYMKIFIYNTDKNGNILTDEKTGAPLGVEHTLDATTVSDDNAYNDAMNQYNYDKALYDQTIQEINAKIEIIQVQDKNLELRLKQLDTEENAISTEMDAVKKVISKNVESSFKTFNA